jgi:uncharacterized protein YbjT (DUF2867 family)
MKVLVTGGTGKSGREVVNSLLKRGAAVRVLTRNKNAQFPAGVESAVGDLIDPDSVRSALEGCDKLYLLVGSAADELTQALLAVNIALEMKIKHITYLSVFQAERFPLVPHFIGKHIVENALRLSGIPYTILRPGAFYQNDVQRKDAIVDGATYPMPIGHAGVAAVDVRDIADVAAISLTEDGHAGKTYNLVGPVALSGPDIASIWSRVLGKQVRYSDVSLHAFEAQVRQAMPSWAAMEFRLMLQGFHELGFAPSDNDVAILTKVLGRSLRTYEDFARETAAGWGVSVTANVR